MVEKQNAFEFREEISSRGIQHLVHFTPTINLLSIIEQGKIMSRSLLEKFDIEQTDIFDYVEFSDEIRFDDKSYINLSVQHPNSSLFSRFRNKTMGDAHMLWCVLKIEPKYIFKFDTLFSVTNAANTHNKRTVGVTGDLAKFRMLFSPSLPIVTSYGSRLLQRENLKDKYPTDEQAEVLVKGEIPIESILEICFRNQAEMASTKAALNGFNKLSFAVDPVLFSNARS